MAVSLEQFVENLIRSGLFSAAELSAFQRSLPPEKRPKDAQELARSLNQAGKLTKYQAAAVYQGKTKGLALDEYIVLDRIGAGGMGEVFKAKHRIMERVVALKVLPLKAMKSPDAVQRFQREVRAAAKLTHPNIVTAYDAREHEGIHCLVMEYVDGKDLSNVLADEGPLPVDRAVNYVAQAARGLEYAHKQGVIHRDIKPGNLLLDREGTVKILDMGLARVGATDTPSDPKGAEPLTASGQMMGTWDYMAPEQAADTHGADHRADIYSLGCTLYRLLTGKPPYSGETAIQTLLAHQQAPIPSLSEARPDVPQELDAVFRKMMAKGPEDRYQSMGDVVADLEACFAGDELPAPSSGAQPAESSTDSKLTAFFQGLAKGGVAAKRKAAPVAEETMRRGPEQETSVAAGEGATVAVSGRKKLVLVGVAGGATGLVLILGLVLMLGRGGEESKEKPAQAAVKTDEERAKDERPSRELTARSSSPDVKEAEPEPPEWQAALDETAAKAKALIAEERFGEAKQLYDALGGRYEDSQLDDLINDAVTAIQGQAGSAYEQAEAQAKQLAGKKEYADARKALDGVINRHGIPANVEAAKQILAQIDAAEEVAEAQMAAAQDEAARTAEIEKQKQVEQRYTEAMKPIEELVAAWDFRAASAALAEVQFEEEEPAARLAAWRAGVARLVDLKVRIIAEINDSDPPLKSTALMIRGAGRDLTEASDNGISAELRTGNTESIGWPDVGPQAIEKLIGLVSTPDSSDDWLAAGVLALFSKNPSVAEKHFDHARSLGADIAPYLAPLAATAFREAKSLLEAKKSAEAEALLTTIEKTYGNTPWFSSNKPEFDAVRIQARQGIVV